jgi:broad specificity phosphatase PhoE
VKEIAVVRHGRHAQTGRYTGRRSDPALTEAGRRQADCVAVALAEPGRRTVFASPLRRALETAAPCCARWQVQPRVLPGLAEIDFGVWDGLSYDEIRRSHPQLQRQWLRDPEETAPPDGETLGAFRRRVEEAWRHILETTGDEPVAVFAHGGTVRSIVSLVLDLRHGQSSRLQVDTGSISRLTVYADGVTVVATLNDTCHLRCFD